MTADANDSSLPVPSISIAKNGELTHVFYVRDDSGKLQRTQHSIPIGKNRESALAAAKERQMNWKIYGAAASKDTRVEPAIDDQPFRLVTNPDLLDAALSNDQDGDREGKQVATSIKCRMCGGAHWTRECPNKDVLETLQDIKSETVAAGSASDLAANGGAGGSAGDLYKSPYMRAVAAGQIDPSSSSGMRRGDDAPSVRIANLPVDTTEYELQLLASKIGPVVRLHLARYDDNACKGFAFVNYSTMETAEKAVRFLDGCGFKNMILTCEHSKRREKPKTF